MKLSVPENLSSAALRRMALNCAIEADDHSIATEDRNRLRQMIGLLLQRADEKDRLAIDLAQSRLMR